MTASNPCVVTKSAGIKARQALCAGASPSDPAKVEVVIQPSTIRPSLLTSLET